MPASCRKPLKQRVSGEQAHASRMIKEPRNKHMTLQSLFNEYLNIKFNRGFELEQTEGFVYGLFEDGSAELFLPIMMTNRLWNGQTHYSRKIPGTRLTPTGARCSRVTFRTSMSTMSRSSIFSCIRSIRRRPLQGPILTVQ